MRNQGPLPAQRGQRPRNPVSSSSSACWMINLAPSRPISSIGSRSSPPSLVSAHRARGATAGYSGSHLGVSPPSSCWTKRKRRPDPVFPGYWERATRTRPVFTRWRDSWICGPVAALGRCQPTCAPTAEIPFVQKRRRRHLPARPGRRDPSRTRNAARGVVKSTSVPGAAMTARSSPAVRPYGRASCSPLVRGAPGHTGPFGHAQSERGLVGYGR